MKISLIEFCIIICIIFIFGAIGYRAYQDITDERPVRCFEGYSYKVGRGGELHLQYTAQGKASVPMKCAQ